MKKPLLALLAAGCLAATLLGACGQKPVPSSVPPASVAVPSSDTPVDISDAPVPGPMSRPDVSLPETPDNAEMYVEMQVQYTDGSNLIEIPYVTLPGGASSAETAEMNNAIAAFANCQDIPYGGNFSDYINGNMGEGWMVLRAFIIEDADSVQIVLHRALFPAPANAGDVFSLVYSRAGEQLVTVEDALEIEEVNTKALAGAIPELLEGETVASLHVPAFYVAGGAGTYFVVADIESTVGQGGTRLYAYTPTTGDFVAMWDHAHLVPSGLLTAFDPPLAWDSK